METMYAPLRARARHMVSRMGILYSHAMTYAKTWFNFQLSIAASMFTCVSHLQFESWDVKTLLPTFVHFLATHIFIMKAHVSQNNDEVWRISHFRLTDNAWRFGCFRILHTGSRLGKVDISGKQMRNDTNWPVASDNTGAKRIRNSHATAHLVALSSLLKKPSSSFIRFTLYRFFSFFFASRNSQCVEFAPAFSEDEEQEARLATSVACNSRLLIRFACSLSSYTRVRGWLHFRVQKKRGGRSVLFYGGYDFKELLNFRWKKSMGELL